MRRSLIPNLISAREKLIAVEEQKKQDIVVKARKQASKQVEKYNGM